MKKKDILIPSALAGGMFCLYYIFRSQRLWGADAGDFLAAISVSGIPHPPGYPWYTGLGVALQTMFPTTDLIYLSSFLSMVPSACALGMLCYLIYRVQERWIPAVIGALILGVSFPYWLYSEVVEVFAFHILFFVTLLTIMYLWMKRPTWKYMYMWVFLFGFSIAHHQTIVFLVPTTAYVIYQQRSWVYRQYTWLRVGIVCFLFLLGFFPYIYVFLVDTLEVNWMGTWSWKHFFDLISRARYGTFTSAPHIGHEPLLRLINVYSFFSLVLQDMRMSGVVLSLIGWVSLVYQKKWRDGFFFFITFSSFLFFLFYASFPLVNDFQLGTYERFLLPLYLLVAIGIGIGVSVVTNIFMFLGKRKEFYYLYTCVFFLLPVGIYIKENKRIRQLQDINVVEQYAKDTFTKIPQGSIMMYHKDTLFFPGQYIYSAKKYRNDTFFLSGSAFGYAPDREKYILEYSDLPISPTDAEKDVIHDLGGAYPFFTDRKIDTSDGIWVPWGLLFRYYPSDRVPDARYILDENENIWNKIQIPDSKKYPYLPLIIAHVPRMYATALYELGMYALQHEYTKEAGTYLSRAYTLDPSDGEIGALYAKWLISSGSCRDAENIKQHLSTLPFHEEYTLMINVLYASECEKNAKKAEEHMKQYQEYMKSKEAPLSDL